MSDTGVDLVDVYVGPDGVLTGSERVAQLARDAQFADPSSDTTRPSDDH
jgi:hypothetical protein